MKIIVDKEFKELLGSLEVNEYKELEETIKKEGCRNSLVVWKNSNILVDGHNRYNICKKHNIDFKVFEKEFNSRDDAKTWIIRTQLARRNLSKYDRSVLALKYKDIIAEQAKQKQKGGQGGVLLSQISVEAKSIDTQKELANIAGVSHDTIHKVEVIEKSAPDKLLKKLKSGNTTINAVYKEVKKTKKEKKHNKIKKDIPTKTKTVETKTGTREWSDYSLNINRGCRNNCKYCYARWNAKNRYKIIKTVDEWTNLEKLKSINNVKKHDGIGMFPTTHDITPENLDDSVTFLKKHMLVGNKILVTSKPNYQCIKTICEELKEYKDNLMFRFTIGSMSDNILSFWEPNAPLYSERIKSLKYAYQNGFQTSISSEPVLDKTISLVICRVLPYVTQTVWLGKMNGIESRVDISNWSKEDICYLFMVYQCNKKEFITELYNMYKNEPKIRWKDSYKKVLGLPEQKEAE